MLFILIISIVCLTCIETFRILVCVPTPSVSHQVVFYPLIKELLKRGHEVVFITTDAMYPKGQAPANLTEIETHDVSYKLWRQKILSAKITTGRKEDLHLQVELLTRTIAKSFEIQVLTPDVQSLIKNKVHVDLLIVESCCKSALSLSHVFKAPVIIMSSLGPIGNDYSIIGAPTYPKLIYPNFLHQKLNNLTIGDKFRVLWDVYTIERFYTNIRVDENKMIKRLFGPDTPSLEELVNNIDMLFVNVYPIWEMNHPIPPSVIFIGGIHQKPQKDLPKELKFYLDSSKKGVVYFSLGTNVSPSTLSRNKIDMLINAFSRLPYDVLMKWDSEELAGTSSNTKVVKWIPQSDLLRHPNLKAFITQGGLQSFDEALTGGVPVVGIPMLADQWYNVERLASLKVGVGLLMEDLTEDKLVNAVNTVIDDLSYRRNMEELRAKLHDQPESGLERAVWWTEYVLRHKGASHLRSPTANMSWSAYLDVELMTALAMATLAVLAVVILSFYLLIRFVKEIFWAQGKLKNY